MSILNDCLWNLGNFGWLKGRATKYQRSKHTNVSQKPYKEGLAKLFLIKGIIDISINNYFFELCHLILSKTNEFDNI